jgi:hypothetical protein
MGCAPAPGETDPTTDPPGDPAAVEGFIFKGPMLAGGSVLVQPLDASLAPDGAALQATVLGDDGAWAIPGLPDGAVVSLTAQGTAWSEATGLPDPAPVTLRAFARARGGALHLHAFGALTAPRVAAWVANGVAFEDAQARAAAELAAALREALPAAADGWDTAVDPYGDDLGAATLFATSAVLARAAYLAGDTVDATLTRWADDLADDGAWTDDTAHELRNAAVATDPDLASYALDAWLDRAGAPHPLPDLQRALDSDVDGLVNLEDNCRYVANPDQALADDGGAPAACDDRLQALAVGPRYGCGLRADGALSCWQVDAGPLGGLPPAPDRFPTPQLGWTVEGAAVGARGDLALGEGAACYIDGAGDLACLVNPAVGGGGAVGATALTGTPLRVPGPFTEVEVDGGVICGLTDQLAIRCVNLEGVALVRDPGPFRGLEIYGEGGVCALAVNGELSWLHHNAEPATLPALPQGAFVQIAASRAGAGCALDEAGTLTCFGDAPLIRGAPAGRFFDVAVGDGVACATDALGAPTCWRDEAACAGADQAPPTTLRAPTGGGCQVCGLDDAGFGACWPRAIDPALDGAG